MSNFFVLSFAIIFSVSLCYAQNILGLTDYEVLGLKLKTAVSELDRQALLNDSQYIFDFADFAKSANATGQLPGVTIGEGGRIVQAISANFPALIGHGMAMTMGFIEPCGLNLPHTHPRATEVNFIVSGTFRIGFFQENEARFIGNNLTTGQMTIFPAGAMHFEQNMGCSNAIFVAAFNNEDPGIQTSTETYFGLPAEVSAVGLGLSASEVTAFAVNLAKNPALGIDECRQRCGIGAPSSSNNSTSSSSNSTNCNSNVTLSSPVNAWNDSVSHYEQFAFNVINTGTSSADTAQVVLNFPLGNIISNWNASPLGDSAWEISLFDLAPGASFSSAGFIWSVPLDLFNQPADLSSYISATYISTQC